MKQSKLIVAWLLDSLTVRRKDAKIIALCFLAATTFWFLNALNKDYSTRLSYPILFDYDDSAYVAIAPIPKKVRLNVSGYGWNLLRKSLQINSSDLVYPISNPLQVRYITGNALLPTITEQLRDIKINYIVEDTIFFEFDRIATKKVRLLADSANIKMSSGFRIVSPITVQPAIVNFKGPASLLKAIPDSIFLEVPGDNIDENFREEVAFSYVQSSLIETSNNKARISFNVAPFVKQTMQMPVQLVNVPEADSMVLADPLLQVSYWVKKDDASRVHLEDFRWVADYKRFNRQDSTVQILLEKKPEFVSEVIISKTTARVNHVKD